MVYDSDLKWINRVIWLLLAAHAVGLILAIYRQHWGVAFAYLVWAGNLWTWRKMNQDQQWSRDRTREVEAALAKVLTGEWK